MRIRRRDALKAMGYSAAGVAGTSVGMKTASADEGAPIIRDICVIGGGSAGTYAAVRLRDLGKSVVVVERKSRLGGHAETFRDAGTGIPVDIGVVVLENVDVVKNYFGRFNLPLIPANFQGGETAYVDYRSGKLVDYTPPAQQEFFGAIVAYQQKLAQSFPYLDLGFQLPNPVPDDLVRPFGAFAEKYGLGAMVPTAFQFGQGLGDMLGDPALYVLKLFSLSVVGSLLGGGFLVAPGGTAQLYDAAAQFLGADALLDSCVLRVERGRKNGIHVWVTTPNGPRRIHCQKLLFAAPPTVESLAPLQPDALELGLFSRFRPNHYSTGVVKLSGLPAGISIQNVAADTRYNLPPLPGIYGLNPTPVPGLWNVKYGSAVPLPDWAVRLAIAADIRRMRTVKTFSSLTFEGFEIFSNHTPFQMMVGSPEINAGYYQLLQSLQGRHDTFYTGAAFQTNDSSLIWRFNEALLPQIVA